MLNGKESYHFVQRFTERANYVRSFFIFFAVTVCFLVILYNCLFDSNSTIIMAFSNICNKRSLLLFRVRTKIFLVLTRSIAIFLLIFSC